MISLIVDESYAYDYLSILRVKALKKDSEETISNFMDCSYIIKMQVGPKLHSEILDSIEYKNLLEANKETFEAVDKAKGDKVKASLIDNLNYKRYLCKQDLQKKFFQSEQTEIKIGYN